MRGLLSSAVILSLLGAPTASAQTPARLSPAPLSPATSLPSPLPSPPLPVPPGGATPQTPRCGTEMFPGFPGWVVRPARPGGARAGSDGCRVHPETVPLPPYVVPGRPLAPGTDQPHRVEGSGR